MRRGWEGERGELDEGGRGMFYSLYTNPTKTSKSPFAAVMCLNFIKT